MSLKENKCEACRIGAPLVTADEKEEFFKEIDGWSIIKLENVERLVKVFKFSDYQEAATFSNAVAMLAEEEDHHPKIVLEWGAVGCLGGVIRLVDCIGMILSVLQRQMRFK